jgi:hypothetical protein
VPGIERLNLAATPIIISAPSIFQDTLTALPSVIASGQTSALPRPAGKRLPTLAQTVDNTNFFLTCATTTTSFPPHEPRPQTDSLRLVRLKSDAIGRYVSFPRFHILMCSESVIKIAQTPFNPSFILRCPNRELFPRDHCSQLLLATQ